jgi:hypothetical protein
MYYVDDDSTPYVARVPLLHCNMTYMYRCRGSKSANRSRVPGYRATTTCNRPRANYKRKKCNLRPRDLGYIRNVPRIYFASSYERKINKYTGSFLTVPRYVLVVHVVPYKTCNMCHATVPTSSYVEDT